MSSHSPRAITLLDELLREQQEPRQVAPGLFSVLPSNGADADYDARATAYDRVVGSALYNRLLWGVSVNRYDRFVEDALASGDGPLLDAGCGSAVFTADAYLDAERPLLLVDRSKGMLQVARDRLTDLNGGSMPSHITLLQADLEHPLLQPESVDTVLSMGMLHLFEDVVGHVEDLFTILRPEGAIFATSLVAERTIGRAYLRLLHASGEVATPRTFNTLRVQLSDGLDVGLETTREGSMAFLRLRKE